MENLKEILTFNKSEKRGIWLLLILLIISFATTKTIIFFTPENDTLYWEEILVEEYKVQKEKRENKRAYNQKARRAARKDSLFYFDPNKIGDHEWQLLGLSKRQAAVIANYISRGGVFRSKEDVRNSFVISDWFYNKIEPYIVIDIKNETLASNTYIEVSRKAIEINSADTIELRQLQGIGPVLARRIVNYRELIGGFNSIRQLTEVYGLSVEVIERNSEILYVDRGNIEKLPVNSLSERELSSHPYICNRLAYAIVQLRKESFIKSKDDIKSRIPSGIEIPEELWPYLKY